MFIFLWIIYFLCMMSFFSTFLQLLKSEHGIHILKGTWQQWWQPDTCWCYCSYIQYQVLTEGTGADIFGHTMIWCHIVLDLDMETQVLYICPQKLTVEFPLSVSLYEAPLIHNNYFSINYKISNVLETFSIENITRSDEW